MPEKEFNLLHEPWILVMKPDSVTEEVSLLELFRRAPEFKCLAGELPTQDMAVLRLLLAILHAVFGRYDLDGTWAPLDSESATPTMALSRWKALRDNGAFPMPIIEDYLSHYEDRFWLFHPERPFYQVVSLEKGTEYKASKMNGELSESNNKVRLFPSRTKEEKGALSYPEAARWLLYVNAFDDTSAKPVGKGLPSPGAGWLGKLGLIAAVGENLFETLLLNLVLLKDGTDELWGVEKPVWEAEIIKAAERTEITIPDNLSELLTLQSRRLLLRREENFVVGYVLLGGDFFPKENALSEQMTLWRNDAKKESDPPLLNPKRHDPARQFWRDFSALMGQGRSCRPPGVVRWGSRLKQENLIASSHFRFQTASVKYGDKDFFADDVFGDSLSFNAGLLTSLGSDWVNRIVGEIELTEKLVRQAGYLAQNLALAAGNADGSGARSIAREQAYFRLDIPFRRWLEGIDPERGSMNAVCDQWWQQEVGIVRALGRELVTQAGPQAFVGRDGHATPNEYNRFLYYTSSRQLLEAAGKKERR